MPVVIRNNDSALTEADFIEQSSRIDQQFERFIRKEGRRIISQERDRVDRIIKFNSYASFFVMILFLIFWLMIFTKLGDVVGIQAGWLEKAPWISASTTTGPATTGPAATAPPTTSQTTTSQTTTSQTNTAPVSSAPAPNDTYNAVTEATRNMITVLGPILIGLAIWMVTAVAERRLKAYDETIEKLRDGLERRFEDFRERSDRRFEDYAKELVKQRSDIKNEVLDSTKLTVDTYVKNEFILQKDKLNTSISESEKRLDDALQEVNLKADGIERRFGHIAENAGYLKDDSSSGPITSVGRVNETVTKLFAENKPKRGSASCE